MMSKVSFHPLGHIGLFCYCSIHNNLWHKKFASCIQNCLMDMRDECARSGTIWASHAVTGSCGMSRRQIWVESIMQTSGRVMCSGFAVGCLLIIGASGRRKCCVVPEPKIPCSIGV